MENSQVEIRKKALNNPHVIQPKLHGWIHENIVTRVTKEDMFEWA